MLKKILLFIALTISLVSQSKTIIWDLGSTLFKTSHLTFARKIGLDKFIAYAVMDLRSPNIKPIVFDILNKMHPNDESPSEIATDNDGNPLPVIMERWLAGLITDNEIMKSVSDYFGHLEKQKYFVSNRQKNLVFATIEQMFNPHTMAAATKPIKAGIKLLNECYYAKNPDGSPRNSLFVLSNWDEASFKLVKAKYAQIFDNCFDSRHIIISGAIGLIKPNKDAYLYVLNTYDLDPKDCIFIDDQCVNILAAESVGITAILLCNSNYQNVRTNLIALGAL